MSAHRPEGPGLRMGRGDWPPPPQLPQGYLQNGYFDEKGHVLPAVVQEWAQAIARSLADCKPKMTATQLRGRYFGEVRRLENKLNAVQDFAIIRPEVLKLPMYVENAVNKGKVPGLFKLFIETNVRWAARGEKEFRKGFVNHFECVVGYYPEIRGR